MKGKQQCRRVVWINNWALLIHCNPKIPRGANKLVSKGWMKREHRRLQKIYGIWYSFCLLGESFARIFEYKQLLFLGSWSFLDEHHLLFISNDEKWFSLKKTLWEICHHFDCFTGYYSSVFSTSMNIWEAWL